MNFPRATFDATVKHIIGLLDEAIPYLNWKQKDIDDGRMTKAGAMGLKIRVLLLPPVPPSTVRSGGKMPMNTRATAIMIYSVGKMS